MGKQKETFQALGKAEILNDSDFFLNWLIPSSPALFAPMTSGAGYVWSIGSSRLCSCQEAPPQFCQHSLHSSALTCTIFCFYGVVLQYNCLNTIQVLPVVLLLVSTLHACRLDTLQGRKKCFTGIKLSEGRWITHFNIWHIQQGSDMSAATCEETGEKCPNVRMTKGSEIKHLGKERRDQNHLKPAQNKQLGGKRKDRDWLFRITIWK